MIPMELIAKILELKNKLFAALRWPVDKFEAFIDRIITRIASFMVTLLS